ncbi:hypothetical protein CPS_2020 [Colwellia psychrerythraea 34H]|uniref:Uncharacterized protein n=1 Tax=Colwellia psychrerythraea (strain 34H / ATCC BAA-681) TaxID=167879 RepID=Q483L6_COLP3|nr:hypothetical protein CPS_2020 [Colwellia psychrerythraea 34H]
MFFKSNQTPLSKTVLALYGSNFSSGTQTLFQVLNILPHLSIYTSLLFRVDQRDQTYKTDHKNQQDLTD